MNKEKIIQKFVVCPICQSKVFIKNNSIFCKKCKRNFKVVNGGIPSMLVNITQETKLSMEKWDKLFLNKSFTEHAEKEYHKYFLKDVLDQTLYCQKRFSKKRGVFLEIGCGQAFLGEEIAKRGWFFIGVDFSLGALLSLKKRLDNRRIKNYLLIHTDIQSLPIKNNSIDLVYGGGVIEHFKNTSKVLNHLYRILKKGGISINTIPIFNIGNLFYRSIMWGGIPNVPILKQLIELIHMKILKGKYMVFGYELQFTNNQLINMHINSGFDGKRINITKFKCHVALDKIKIPFLKNYLKKLCENNRHFWPMVKVIAQKT